MGNLFSTIFGSIVALIMSFVGATTGQNPVQRTPEMPVQLPATTSSEIYIGATTAKEVLSSSSAQVDTVASSVASFAVRQDTTSGSGALDLSAIPLGDGKVSTAPKIGYVYACEQTFRGGGAMHAGDWIDSTTWNLTKKISVEGSVSWPHAVFSVLVQGAERILQGNGLPVQAVTGIFPIQQNDPAYQYDRNPNTITEYSLSQRIPANPTFAAHPACVPMGVIGYALNGVALYNALDDAGRDAVAHEVQDSCEGHPQQEGQYHYHGPSSCMPHVNEKDAVVGYALDGFPITSLYAANGKLYDNGDLDECHGIASPITIDGVTKNMYHYVLTYEYPYTIGCFKGTPAQTSRSVQQGQNRNLSQTNIRQQEGGKQPPQAAIDACTSKPMDAACSVSTPQGSLSGMCRNTPDGSFACVPQ